ncbi:hypothetical protein EAI_04516 [Harpegnathos saltator]|uniref:Uncharacterized protein n=1 Tax=Harpegnathos saltator TaxID=610380 RepID=E2BKX4_HARSA|nr:hypothetical protein EAI_04516 [Harpegnathos saltator]
MVENAALERHFKPIIEPLKQIARSSTNMESAVDVKTKPLSMSTSEETKRVILKLEEKIKRMAKLSPVTLTTPKRKLLNDPLIVPTSTEALQHEELHGMSHKPSPIDNLLTDDDDENVSETPDESAAASFCVHKRQLKGARAKEVEDGPQPSSSAMGSTVSRWPPLRNIPIKEPPYEMKSNIPQKNLENKL